MTAAAGPGIVRELKGAPLAILTLLIYAQRRMPNTPVTNTWLATYSGYTDKPVAKALAYLEGQGYARRTPAGWLAANAAMQLPLFPGFFEIPVVDNSAEPVDNPVENQPAEASTSRNFSDSPRKSFKSSQSVTDSDKKTDSDLPQDGENPTDRILDAAGELLGERPFGGAGDYPDTDHLLAWIAQAWVQRDKFEHPARIVYTHARHPTDKRHRPGTKYRAWWAHLPPAFIDAAGLTETAQTKQKTAIYRKYIEGFEKWLT